MLQHSMLKRIQIRETIPNKWSTRSFVAPRVSQTSAFRKHWLARSSATHSVLFGKNSKDAQGLYERRNQYSFNDLRDEPRTKGEIADDALGNVKLPTHPVDPKLTKDYLKHKSSGLSPLERQQRVKQMLQKGEASAVEFHQGSELDLGGLPPDQYHASAPSTMPITTRSALYQEHFGPKAAVHRTDQNTWASIRTGLSYSANDARNYHERPSAQPMVEHSEYSPSFSESVALDHHDESVQHSISIYTKRKLLLDGLTAIPEFISPFEELDICAELMRLLTTPGFARYIPEECRYSLNLFEHRLGLPTQRSAIAHPFSESPCLTRVIERAVSIGLLPRMPNAMQVSEFVGPWAFYPAQRKPPSIGPYYGILSLVSKGVMVLSHVDQPWVPQFLALPRSLHIISDPILQDFRIGYPYPQHVSREFKHSSRNTKDYRLEVAFACLDVQQRPLLRDSKRMTDHAVKTCQKMGLYEFKGETRERIEQSQLLRKP